MRTVADELGRGAAISIISLVDALLREADERRASDIHIDPNHSHVRVRFRIDGVLHEAYQLPTTIHAEVISRVKVLANLRTDEHQATQDGRFRFTYPGDERFIDLRVSIVPTYHGENAVLRILSDKAAQYSLEMLGFSDADQQKIHRAIYQPNGMILATGPTGSGKTTTLYTLVKMLNQPDVSILTIEDPIEYAIADITQMQVNPRAGLTFVNGLRSILRQDPNIIMVGEIRDGETASIAVNTALTGHLVLSTLHTNDAATTLPRLLDMGIDAYLVASTVSIAIAQRLVRKICPSCARPARVPRAVAEALATVPLTVPVVAGEVFSVGAGCDACDETGYAGRVCINEVLVADDTVREAILRKASATEIRNIAIAHGMTTMLEDGFHKVRTGRTSIEEVLRVIHA